MPHASALSPSLPWSWAAPVPASLAPLAAAPTPLAATSVPAAKVTFTFEGNAADFKPAQQAELLRNLAGFGGIPFESLRVVGVRQGSIIVDIEIIGESISPAASTAFTSKLESASLDDMRAARLADEQKMRMLEKEREAARAERDRLAQALADLDAEQARQAEAARAQACTSGRLCLDISADSGDSSPSDSPSKVGGGARDGRDGDVGGQLQDEKEQLLAEAEQGRAFLIRSHAMERERQEEVLRARMEARSRRRGAARNRWDEASAGGIASDACVPGGMAF